MWTCAPQSASKSSNEDAAGGPWSTTTPSWCHRSALAAVAEDLAETLKNDGVNGRPRGCLTSVHARRGRLAHSSKARAFRP